MILDISSKLNAADVDNLRYFANIPTDQDCKLSGIKLLELIEQQGKYSPTNIAPLESLLRRINRCDIVSYVIEPYKALQTRTPSQASGITQQLLSKPMLVPHSPTQNPEYPRPIPESLSHSKGDVDEIMVSSNFEQSSAFLSPCPKNSRFDVDTWSVLSVSELKPSLTRSSCTINSSTFSTSLRRKSISSVLSDKHGSSGNINFSVHETHKSAHADHKEYESNYSQQSAKLFSVASIESVAQLSECSSITEQLVPNQPVRKEIYNMEVIPPESFESSADSQQKSSASATDTTTVYCYSNSSGSSTNPTISRTCNEASGSSTGASAIPDKSAVVQVNSGSSCSYQFQLSRKLMGKKVLNHQHNSCFKHKFNFLIDKKRRYFKIVTEVYPCGLGKDGEGDDRYVSVNAIITPSNLDYLLNPVLYKCMLKLIVQVTLVDPSGSSQFINEVSGVVTLINSHKEFVMIISRVLSLHQIIHGENKYFKFHVRAELILEPCQNLLTKDVQDDFVNVFIVPK